MRAERRNVNTLKPEIRARALVKRGGSPAYVARRGARERAQVKKSDDGHAQRVWGRNREYNCTYTLLLLRCCCCRCWLADMRARSGCDSSGWDGFGGRSEQEKFRSLARAPKVFGELVACSRIRRRHESGERGSKNFLNGVELELCIRYGFVVCSLCALGKFRAALTQRHGEESEMRSSRCR